MPTINQENVPLPESFQDMLPRTINAETDRERIKKGTSGQFQSLGLGGGNLLNQIAAYGAGNNILRNPSRRFYDPEITTTAIYLPRTLKQINRWCRWFYDHDELVGAVLDVHAELPYSKAEIVVDDPHINTHIQECIEKTGFFSKLPAIDLEFMKIGEIFIHTPWNSKTGMWEDIIVHNPDFIEVRFTPFADQESVIELIPDDELKSLVHSTKPEDQRLKGRLPQDVFRRVLTGKNITLDPDEVTHIARRSNPYDVRGTSIISRIFRLLMYEDKLREAQITIADNFIYPLKIFKLGDANKGWIPNETHQRALAQMLQQSTFDPNFSLIYHYGLNVEYVTVADKVMRLEKEWSDITEKKMVALGVGKQFLSGESTYACFTKGTKITTPQGYKNVEDIEVGDSVIDKDGMEQKVTDNWDEGIPNNIIEITLWGGKKFKCTDNHKWSVWTWPRKCACGCGREVNAGKLYAHSIGKSPRIKLNPIDIGRTTIRKKYISGLPINYNPIKKLKAEEIKQWDYLMIPRNFVEVDTNTTETSARLLGYFIAEGCYEKHHTTKELHGIRLCFGENESKYIDDVTNLCAIEGIPISSFSNKQGALHLRSITQNIVKDKVNWFKKHAGEYSHKKQLSKEVMGWSLNLKKELIKGIFRGDGCHQINKRNGQHTVHFTTTSKILANQIELILAQIGFPVNWTIQDNNKRNLTSKYKRKPIIRLDIYGKFAFDLAKLIWEEECTFDFDDSHKFKGQKAFVDDNYVYLMVKSVESIKNTKKVYNLTVENSHSYLVDNVGTYNSANVGLQVQLSRYKAKRDLFQVLWIQDKFFRIMAEKNNWYRRDKKELVGQYRVSRSGRELEERLIVPKILWHKKLMMRDDQAFMTFMNNVYAQGKGPISAITLLQLMGMSLEDELSNKKKQKELEEKIGAFIHPLVGSAAGVGSPLGGTPPPTGSVTAKIKDKLGLGKKKTAETEEISKEDIEDLESESREFIGKEGTVETAKPSPEEIKVKEADFDSEITKNLHPVDDDTWFKNLESPSIPSEVKLLLINLNNKLSVIDKKSNGDFKEGILQENEDISKILTNLYKQGKLHSYSVTEFYPIHQEYYSDSDDLTDYSDLMLSREFEEWTKMFASSNLDKSEIFKHLRNLGNTCFAYGQLKGYQEQGVYTVKLSNVVKNDGLRYGVKQLLSKGRNLGSIISAKNEILIMYPCIEGFDDEEFGNNVDPHIQRHRSHSIAGINVKDCPIEYIPQLSRFLNKVGKFIKKDYDNIIFVLDVVDLEEWETSQKEKLEKKYSDIPDKDAKNNLIRNTLSYEKIQKKGMIPVFNQGKNLYISNWVGMEECSFTESLLKHITVVNDSNEKVIRKAFKQSNFDLSQEEMSTYKVFNQIEPISDDPDNPRGFKLSEKFKDSPEVNYKLKQGKLWDVNGKCLNGHETDEVLIFVENLRLWIDYPHLLNDELKKSFEEL